ncbi:MAG: tRNA guanosine(34) transglycosylase Tgt [Candidatus Nomurabacteria bacterium]|nr:tRNA guanosine(34) transglycosylase Tgt [Candidatus Nomurabacteria bacterium]
MKSDFSFKVTTRLPGRLGRTGVITTPHGQVKTPAFVAVGTHAEVKYLSPADLRGIGVQAMLSNAYHLYRRAAELDAAGGLAAYSGWDGPTITDSGGFQVMSLGSGMGKIISVSDQGRPRPHCRTTNEERLARVSDEGVTFRHPVDGRVETFTPEVSMQTQHQIGADIMMAFDELTGIDDDYQYNAEALERTRRWAQRCLLEHDKLAKERSGRPYQALYGVLQGAKFEDLRRKAARDLGGMGFDGFGLGGAFNKEQLVEILQWCNAELPENKPRHLLGLSRPDDIFIGSEHGVDTFDCVAPTREARHGRIYTLDGDINIRNSQFTTDSGLLDDGCDCATCQAGHTRAEVRRLLKSTDPIERVKAFNLASIHNVRFIVRLVDDIRAAIDDGGFDEFRNNWLARYY